jgi:hypothetical protein
MQQSGPKKIEDNTSLAPSQLFDSRLRGYFLQAIKESVGKGSKSTLENMMKAKWECVHSTTQMTQDFSGWQGFWEKIAGNSPMVVICTGSFSGKRTQIGGYISAKFPAFVACEDGTEAVKAQPEDFCFLHQEGTGTYFAKPRSGTCIGEMLTSYEGGCFALAQDFLMVPWGHDYSFHAGSKEYLDEFKVEGVPQPTTAWRDLRLSSFANLEKVEFW